MINSINGQSYRMMLCGAAAALQNKKEEINNLNVFPVPDGDTGTNMSLTVDGAASRRDAPDERIGAYSEAAAKDMMRAARGNSGVILSLFFRGVARAFAGHDTADAALLLEAFRTGAESAKAAVMNPVEGTILTVTRECCDGITEADIKAEGGDIIALLDRIYAAAKVSLARTPELLPALKRARVVDSGGCGFVYIIDGMRAALTGDTSEYDTLDYTDRTTKELHASADFSEYSTEDIKFSFCTECLIARAENVSDDDMAKLRTYLSGMGDSIVITDDDEIIKLHIHTNEPMTVLSHLMGFGTLQFSKIENMKLQHSRLISGEGLGEGSGSGSGESSGDAAHTIERKPYGIFAVANGDGLSDVFRDLGADVIIAGGQSMNPSTEDFIEAIRSVPCETAILLPNNSNIVMTAMQVARLTENVRIEVLKTTTIPQGISALVAFNPSRSPDDNIRCMNEAIHEVKTLSVTRAIRDAEANGFFVRKKQYIGIVDNDLRCAADSLDDCIRSMAKEISDREIITIYYGKGVKPAEAKHTASVLTDALGGCEVMTVPGLQPIYPYLISAE